MTAAVAVDETDSVVGASADRIDDVMDQRLLPGANIVAIE